MSRIVITNACNDLVDNATAQKWVDAIQRQIALDFAPAWNEAATLHYIGDSATEQPQAGDWLIRLVREASEAGTLGVHWLASGIPTGEVGVQTCIDDKVEPSSCLSHELLEMVLDPFASWAAQVGKVMLALEACDRVENSDPDYKIDGVAVENFSLPAAFLDGGNGPFDFRGKCTSNDVLPNGYQLLVDLGSSQWTQVTGALARAAKLKAGPSSRRAARMLRAGVDPKTLVLVTA